MKKNINISIIGSHGLFAGYGGWDQLVNNLCLRKNKYIKYLVFNSVDTPPKQLIEDDSILVKILPFKASGYQGLLYDFISILLSFRKCDVMLLLGAQGIPLALVLSFFYRFKIVVNPGGIEWERPKFGYFAKSYLRFCFNLASKYADDFIIDNKHYLNFIKKNNLDNVKIIPYGGEIDYSLDVNFIYLKKYIFLKDKYFLSISRSLEDNNLFELCSIFSLMPEQNLVLLSNFSNSDYGKSILRNFSKFNNIFLIDSLYNKSELDLIRRQSFAYIHTHTLCGTAPSLVEMIIANSRIFSIDVPQNRFTLNNNGFFYKTYDELRILIESNELPPLPPLELIDGYAWSNIILRYEDLYYD